MAVASIPATTEETPVKLALLCTAAVLASSCPVVHGDETTGKSPQIIILKLDDVTGQGG